MLLSPTIAVELWLLCLLTVVGWNTTEADLSRLMPMYVLEICEEINRKIEGIWKNMIQVEGN